jgi:cell shape-determining protein MreC
MKRPIILFILLFVTGCGPSNEALRKENAELRREIEVLEEKYSWLSARKADLEKLLRTRMYIDKESPIHDVPEIEGAVIGLKGRINQIIINVGEEDGVRKGYEFYIYSGYGEKGLLGKLVIEEVLPLRSSGRILLDKTKGKVRHGDRVYTYARE